MKLSKIKQDNTLRALYDYQNELPEHLINRGVTNELISEAIALKERAIFKDAKWWVTMNDNFMSGWGAAKGKTNKYIIACDTLEQARQIESHAHTRNEMKYVNICSNKPQTKSYQFVSWNHYEDMGGCWIKN